MEKWSSKKVSIFLFSCILAMLLFFYSFVNLTYAWLFTFVENESDGHTDSAGVTGTLSTTDEIVVTMPQANVSADLSQKVVITNTGTMDALLRVFYAIYVDEDSNQIATTSALSSLNINNSFVASDENIENVYSGYYYYNSILPVNGEVSFLTSAVPTFELANRDVKIKVMYELVNYQGGAYQLGQDIPWNNTPVNWAFNYDYIIKPQSSTISPKLDIKFSEVGKIQMTAKTSATERNVLMCQYSGAYIGYQSLSSWNFHNLECSANMTPVEFANGEFNTITFNITGCTAAVDEYITLVWDGAWSKEVCYKQIKIWDTEGNLVYNIVPKIEKDSLTNFYSAGELFDKVSNSVLDMYKINGATYELSEDKYLGFSQIVYSNDFESLNVGDMSHDCSDGAAGVVVTNEHYYGEKSLKILNTLNKEDVFNESTAKFGWLGISAQAGYRYTMSLWVKSDAPVGSLAYSYFNSKLSGDLPGIVITKNDGTQNFSVEVDYYSNGEWTLISATTDIITESGQINFGFEISTGIQYYTYIDDVIIKAHI